MHLSLNNSLGKWILPKESSPFSPEATNYFSRLDAAGDTTYVDYKQPLANYIDSLVTLGGAYWDTMESSTSFVGVGIQGITVPLRDGMTVPTNNNFVAGDLNQLTGLLCNGSTKRIRTNTNQSNYAQNDTSVSAYRTEDVSGTNPFYFGTNLANGFGARGVASFITACYGGQAVTGSASTAVGLLGLSRSASTGYDYRSNGTTGTRTTASVTPASGNLDIFAIDGTTSGSFRLATYHAGPALNLATLEGLQATLITEVEAVWNTLVYQSDFANGATEYTPVRVTAVAPDSPDASTNVISLTPKVDTNNYYIRLNTSNVNTSDTYLTKFDVFIAPGQLFDGIRVLDWIGPIKFAKTFTGSELGQWVSVSFLTTYPVYGTPAIYLTNAGSTSFVGNNSDVAYIRNVEILEL